VSALPGELAALVAAALWAVAVALFRGPIETYGARTVNLAKCALALACLATTAWLAGELGVLTEVPARDLLLVAASGVVGLTLGDTSLFAAVRRLGPYRTLLFQNLAPGFTALTAFAWLGRAPGWGHALGSVVTLAGVALVLTPRRGTRAAAGPHSWSGILFAIGAAAGQGIGIVLAKEGMTTLSELPAATLRLGAATAFLAIGAAWSSRRASPSNPASASPRRGGALRIVLGTMMGTYLAFFLMMVAIARAQETVAAVLLSTTPVFGLFVDAALGRERITPRAIAGTSLAVAGVVILALGS
jgi:drug/metabolite transporter (DMT)-like permease